MAKTTAPLYSLSASGTIARAVSYRTSAGQQIAQAPKLRQSPPSAILAASQGRWQEACSTWCSIDPAVRQEWQTAAQSTNLPPMALWCREWTTQRATPSTLPRIPVEL